MGESEINYRGKLLRQLYGITLESSNYFIFKTHLHCTWSFTKVFIFACLDCSYPSRKVVLSTACYAHSSNSLSFNPSGVPLFFGIHFLYNYNPNRFFSWLPFYQLRQRFEQNGCVMLLCSCFFFQIANFFFVLYYALEQVRRLSSEELHIPTEVFEYRCLFQLTWSRPWDPLFSVGIQFLTG